MQPSTQSTFELALFSLKKKALADYVSQHDAFEEAIKKLDGFKWLHTYQNLNDPNELIDLAEWESLKQAKAADAHVQESADFGRFFAPMEKVEYFNHMRFVGNVSKENVSEQSFMELYVYRVDKAHLEKHLAAKQRFAEYLKETVPGFSDLSWFQIEDDDEWQVDLYFYDLFPGIQEMNKEVEQSKASQELMATIAELKYFKTFSLLVKEPVKVDLTKSKKSYYKASGKVEEVELDGHQFLSVSGIGSPESEAFNQAVPQLYQVAYQVKFVYKELGRDFVVPKMEGFWYVEDGQDFEKAAREEWHWEIMIPLPDFVHYSVVKSKIDALDMAEVVKLKEEQGGKHVQMLHLGSYEQEEETIRAIHNHIEDNNYSFAGYHREVYLNDPRKTAEEKLKTIIRYQVA